MWTSVTEISKSVDKVNTGDTQVMPGVSEVSVGTGARKSYKIEVMNFATEVKVRMLILLK